jgi:hypothetical protein
VKELLSITTNIYYTKDESGKETKYNELVFLFDKPAYKRTNEGDLARHRKVEETRFVISEKGFNNMIKLLLKLQNATESELK